MVNKKRRKKWKELRYIKVEDFKGFSFLHKIIQKVWRVLGGLGKFFKSNLLFFSQNHSNIFFLKIFPFFPLISSLPLLTSKQNLNLESRNNINNKK